MKENISTSEDFLLVHERNGLDFGRVHLFRLDEGVVSQPHSLHLLNVRPERGFARKHQPQTAYLYQRGSSSTTNRTRRYSSSGMTTTSMAFPKFDNVPVALKREKDLTAMTALSLV